MIKIVVAFFLANGHVVYFSPHVRFGYEDQCKAMIERTLPIVTKAGARYFKQPGMKVGMKCEESLPET